MLRGIRQKLSYTVRDAGALLGMNKSGFREARGARILVYHGICRKDHLRFNNIFLQLRTFEAHLQFCKKYFNVISLDDYYAQRFSNDRFNLCITFDDGYENNYRYVLPLLEKYQLPATFFITAIRQAGYDILWNDFLGMVNKYGPQEILYKNELFRKGPSNNYIAESSGQRLIEILRSAGFAEKAEMMELLYPLAPFRSTAKDQEYWQQMTAPQISKLSASPWVTIGSHGFYHNDLGRIAIADAEKEMTGCREFLEKCTGKEIKALAFPYGTYSPAAVAAAGRAGYSQLLALHFHFPEDHAHPAMRERLVVNPFISVDNQMLATIKNTYAF